MKKILLLFFCLTLLFSCKHKSNIEKILNRTVEEVNNSCPMFVDEETRLEYVEIDEDGFFHYIYTFPMLTKNDIDIPYFYISQSERLNNEYKTNSYLSNFRKYNVTLRYTYFDMYDNQIISIIVSD